MKVIKVEGVLEVSLSELAEAVISAFDYTLAGVDADDVEIGVEGEEPAETFHIYYKRGDV